MSNPTVYVVTIAISQDHGPDIHQVLGVTTALQVALDNATTWAAEQGASWLRLGDHPWEAPKQVSDSRWHISTKPHRGSMIFVDKVPLQ